MIGRTLGHYQIVSLLGAGGMGEVYLAQDSRLDRRVALKSLPAAVASDPERMGRFVREAKAASALNHPNVAHIYEIGQTEGVSFIAMEYVEGQTLAYKIGGHPLQVAEIIEIGIQAADALDEAHGKGITHRDIKPTNIMVTPRGQVKVLDFGLAKVTGPAGQEVASKLSTLMQTTPGVVMGTLPYMSPEQALGREMDHRSDLFSLGVVLYEMATGRLAFAGASASETLDRILHAQPGAMARLNSEVPAELERVVRKCLEKDRERRYQSARELLVDLKNLKRDSDPSATLTIASQARWRWAMPWSLAVMMAALLLLAGGALLLFRFGQPAKPARLEYIPLTKFSDSAVAPALSPDGRMLAFIRGEETFVGPGEIYVKLLPDGEPVQLTHDGSSKMGPTIFSPDGSRIAYAVNTRDTWTVPVFGGEPSLMLANASGLTWIGAAGAGRRRVLFSEWTGEGIHMGTFTSTESRSDERKVYLPADVNGMAHRSFLSPDQKSVLLVEMNLYGWLPCRLVPFDGSSLGKSVGPSPAQCTDAAWSLDGKWMYFSANAGNGFHIWRQRFPDGPPEQITSGPTEEQGIAFAPDGHSFVTSAGESQSTVWVHDSRGERQITSQGYAYLPSFSADGKRLYYLERSRANRRFVSGELWVTNLETGKRERLLPDFLMEHYDVSRDGNRVVFVMIDDAGHSPVWVATLDGSSPPRRLSSFDCVRALFDPNGGVLFVGGERGAPYLYHIKEDGTGLRKVVSTPVLFIYDVSPDGKALALWVERSVFVYPSDGGAPTLICSGCATAGGENRGVTPSLLSWSPDGKFLYFQTISLKISGQTYAVPLQPGQILPPLPAGGLGSMANAATLPGARLIPEQRVFVSADPSVYAFLRVATHRNIYRISVP
ncbi:MAG TPA: protein kinase [Acidobacteriota bacterium]|jgi:Tol biopolymer transport system component/predicted Ser/Thr protein kinase|nr:protein kinase [Acidobacteriota bacterium]